MTNDTTTLQDLKERAETAFNEYADHQGSGGESMYLGDAIGEIADDCVPVYNSDLLELANNNLEVALEEPEIEPQERTVISLIQTKTYEILRNHLYQYAGDNPKLKEAFRD